jgi:adenylate kinase family enzyme
MNILITGVAGSGKSTIARLLQARGYTAYDTDTLDGLSAWIERSTGKPDPDFNPKGAEDWIEKYDWLWNESFLRKLLADSKDMYFCGSSANQEQFYSLFDKIFLLEVNDQLLVRRLTKADREHDFGNRPGELDTILGWYKGFQSRTKAANAHVIDANRPVDEIVEEVLNS